MALSRVKSGKASGADAPPPQNLATAAGAFKFDIPSDFQQSRIVQEQIIAAAAGHGFAGNDLFAIKLALEEALVNAIKHGNQLDGSKRVCVEAQVSAEQFSVSVEDQGHGFDRSDVPDPTAAENLCKCSGRGLMLMDAYMSSVSFAKKGRRVTMTKLNRPSPE